MGLLSWLRGGRGAERTVGPPATPPSPDQRFDLVELPPLQRTLSAPTLVTDPAAFERGLPTRRPTALSRPLGHLVSAEAPSGLVAGVTTPVQRSLIEFPVRAPQPVLGPSGAPEASGSPRGAAPTTGKPTPPPTPAPAPAAPVSSPALGPAQRTSDAPVPAQAPQPPEPPEPSLPSDPPPARDQAVDSGAEPSVRPLVGEQPLLDVPSEDPGPAPEPLPPAQRSLPPTRTAPSTPTPAPRPRVPGLGAPLPALPPTAQRAATAASPTSPAPSPVPAPAPVRPEPGLPAAPPPVPTAAPEPVAPLLADRPLVLRTVSAEAGPVVASPAAAPAEATVPVRWEPAAGQRNGAPAPVQRAVVERTVDRPAPPPPPAPVLPAPAPLPRSAPRDAGEVAVTAGIAQRMADGSVVFAPPPSRRTAPPTAPPAPAPFVQREVATEEPPPPPPDAAAPEPAPELVSEPDPAAATATATEAATTTPGSAPAATPPVTDEFVRALYPPLARLLKADLRLERERASRLISTRF
ncbi:hypothetical protein ACFY7C_06825 [Streptomyces sp. NPDC012769]|uniref:hypothetical protein n=1 Tax=Streptomyces sp. NPDC012769 TaxID=3364848 RepID=UPI0036A61614